MNWQKDNLIPWHIACYSSPMTNCLDDGRESTGPRESFEEILMGVRNRASSGATGRFHPHTGGEESGFACLDRIISDVWTEGYGHHISRLMVLCNLATLLHVFPRQLTDWFWAAYTDAYDWVVEPNVLGMGTFAVGELMTTKPYVSGPA